MNLGEFWLMEGCPTGSLSQGLAGRCTKLPALWDQASTGCNTLAQAKKIGNVMKYCGFRFDSILPSEELLSDNRGTHLVTPVEKSVA